MSFIPARTAQTRIAANRLTRLKRLPTSIAHLMATLGEDVAYWLRVISHTLALIVLIALANACLMGALVVKVFSPKLGWRLSCWTASWFWGFMQRHFEQTRNAGPVIRVTGDEIPEGEAAIFLMNHLSYADFYLTQHLAVKAGMLGQCRYFAKRELVWMIPLFGWAFWAMDMILVSRNWTKDERSIQNAFSRLTSHNHEAWIGLCPEGTRISPPKLLASRAFSRRHGKPELRHLLWPRTKGFVATVRGMRGNVGAVYDFSYVYITPERIGAEQRTLPGRSEGSSRGEADEGNEVDGMEVRSREQETERVKVAREPCRRSARVPSLAELVGTRDLAAAGYEFSIHVRRIPIIDLPTTDEALRQWCEDRWLEKDEIIHNMLRDAGIEMDDSSSESDVTSDATDGADEKEGAGGKRAWSF